MHYTDKPEDCDYADVPVMKPSRLAVETVLGGPAEKKLVRGCRCCCHCCLVVSSCLLLLPLAAPALASSLTLPLPTSPLILLTQAESQWRCQRRCQWRALITAPGRHKN